MYSTHSRPPGLQIERHLGRLGPCLPNPLSMDRAERLRSGTDMMNGLGSRARRQGTQFFLNSYRPICSTKRGRQAMQKHGLPPFIDSSCRREPDFEASYPSISGLCRVDKFVPRLQVGDQVAYLTCKIRATSKGPLTRYFVAVLEVVERFERHEDAAAWYGSMAPHPPSNCIVPSNGPQAYDRTAGIRAQDRERYRASEGDETVLREWNAAYATRAESCGVFLACRALYLELWSPPEVTEAVLTQIFGKVRGTQTPPNITGGEMDQLRRRAAPGIALPDK